MLKLWFDAARWCYNETVAHLRKPGTVANWKNIKTAIIHSAPERLKASTLPGQEHRSARRLPSGHPLQEGQRGVGQGQGHKENGWVNPTPRSASAAASTQNRDATYQEGQ